MSTSALSILWAVVGVGVPTEGRQPVPPLASPSAHVESVAPTVIDVESPSAEGLEFGATLNLRQQFIHDSPDGASEEGTQISDALVAFEGHWYGYDVSLAFDLDETVGTTLDRAWAQGRLDTRHSLRFGRLRRPFLWSSFADEGEFVFPYRSRLGREFANSDDGLELLADYTNVDVRVALTNGADGTGNARQGTARVGFHLLGDRVPMGERPRGNDGLSIFLAYTDEGSVASGDAFAAELHGQLGQQRLHVEWLDAAEGLGDQRGATGTWSVALNEGTDEFAVRLERLSEPQSRTVIGAALSHSFLRDVVRGQVAAEYVRGGDGTLDGWLLSAGLVLTL